MILICLETILMKRTEIDFNCICITLLKATPFLFAEVKKLKLIILLLIMFCMREHMNLGN